MKERIFTESFKIFQIYKKAFSLYSSKRGTTIAASSTFYLIISLIPLVLLLLRLTGLMISDFLVNTDQIVGFIQGLFPQADDLIFKGIAKFINSHLLAHTKFSVVNSFFLILSGMSFLNSIWNGLYILTENKENINMKKHFKGVLILGVTFLLIFSFLILPSLIYSILGLIEHSSISQSLLNQGPLLTGYHHFFEDMDQGFFSIYRSFFFIGLFLLIYFSLFFKFTFSGVINYKNSFYGALTFVFGIAFLKQFFIFYLNYVRSSMIVHYGDYYTVILALMWVFFLMNIFYFSSCVTHIAQVLDDEWENSLHKP